MDETIKTTLYSYSFDMSMTFVVHNIKKQNNKVTSLLRILDNVIFSCHKFDFFLFTVKYLYI